MPEPLIDDKVNLTPEIEEDEFSYEVVEETPAEDPQTLLLQTQIAEMQAKLDEAKAVTNAPRPEDNGMLELAAAIKLQNSPKLPDAAEEFNARFQKEYEAANKDYHNDPLGNSTKINALMMEKVQHDMDVKFNQQAATISQLNAQSADSDLMAKYGDEIKEIASSLPPSSSVYQEAVSKVKMNHFDEIMAVQVEQAIAKQLEALKPKKTPEETAASVDFTNSTAAPVPAEVKKPVPKVTQAEVTRLEGWAKNHMLDWSVKGNKEYTIQRYLKHKASGGMI